MFGLHPWGCPHAQHRWSTSSSASTRDSGLVSRGVARDLVHEETEIKGASYECQ
jgi:hypothetical protein